MRRNRVGQTCVAAALMLWPITAGAFDAVNFTWPDSVKPEVRDSVKAVSVLAELETREDVVAADVLAAAQGDYARIVEALYAQGYYGPVVRILLDGREAAAIPPFEAPRTISRAQVVVEPGPLFKFGTARVAPRAKGTPETEGFDSGEPARATAVRAAAQDTVDGWRRKGHATAEIAGQQITARHDDARLDVDVQVDPGPVYTFGEVEVTTTSAVKPARIRQIAGIPRGETFDPDAVEKGAERLRATGTFRSVVLNEDPQADSTLDVLVEVTDRRPRRLGFGAELSSTEGLTLSSFWLHRNLLGGAERFRVDAEVRQLAGVAGMKPDYEIAARFEKPAVYGADTLFFATAKVAYEEEPDYISRSAEVGVGISQEFTDTITGELGFTLSRSEITDTYLPGHPVRRLNVLAMPSALTWDTRDSTTDATLGAFVRVDAEPFTLLSGGNASGMHLEVDARGYKSFGEDDGVTMALRLQLGSLYGIEAAGAPPDYLFHSGGGGTVRGQPYQSLDATYANGTTLGGRSFLGASLEARVDVTRNIGVVAFADTGYIGPESFYDGSGSWHSGAGLGLRYATPVGPIRFDVAAPVGGDTGDGVQLYIGIGQSF